MSSFEFGHKVTISGKEYQLNSDLDAIQKAMSEAAQKTAELKMPKEAKKVYAITRKAVDTALGKGSYNEITEGKTMTVYDIVDLIGFIATEVRTVQSKRAKLNVDLRRAMPVIPGMPKVNK